MSIGETESVMKSLPTRKSPGPEGLTSEFFQMFGEKITGILEKFFREQKKAEVFPAHYEGSVTWIPRPENDIKRNKNYRLIPLINIDANILNKVLTNLNQQNIKRLIYHTQVGLISGMQCDFNIKNEM